MPSLPVAADKRAHTVEEAAYNHLLVFTQTVSAWPEELKARLPPFAALYVDPPGRDAAPGPVTALERRLRKTPGPIKLMLTGQKGAGKSWAMEHLAAALEEAFLVIRVSATDASGATLAEAEITDVMVLLCEAVAQKVTAWDQLAGMELVVARWAQQFKGLHGLPAPPSRTADSTVGLSAYFASFASRMRSSGEVRELVRSVGADDLVQVANAMLATLAATRQTLILFDDLDKVHASFARRLFGEQFTVVGRVASKMVLTFPYSLQFENVLTQPREVLLNLQVKADRNAEGVRQEALDRFVELLGRLVDLELVEGSAVELAVAYSGGIIREFGRILARAFEKAALVDDVRVVRRHVEDAVRDLRIELILATQDGPRRESLARVRRHRQLDTELDRTLVNENLVVQYVNGKPWFDVHPLLAAEVDEWVRSAPTSEGLIAHGAEARPTRG